MADGQSKPTPKPGPPPVGHVAIIMDGNGRWANERDLPRIEGHREGAQSVRTVVTRARELGVGHLTLFAFSSENWGRPPREVAGLMDLLYDYLVRERKTMIDNDIAFGAIGRVDRLPLAVRTCVSDTEKATRGLSGMRLTLALSYGGRDDITRATQAIAKKVDRGEIDPAAITEQTVREHLYAPQLPDPDVLIRTSGERRISNFLLWQLAYSELIFVEKPWPAFGADDLDAALAAYHARERRFGLTSDQVHSSAGAGGAASAAKGTAAHDGAAGAKGTVA